MLINSLWLIHFVDTSFLIKCTIFTITVFSYVTLAFPKLHRYCCSLEVHKDFICQSHLNICCNFLIPSKPSKVCESSCLLVQWFKRVSAIFYPIITWKLSLLKFEVNSTKLKFKCSNSKYCSYETNNCSRGFYLEKFWIEFEYTGVTKFFLHWNKTSTWSVMRKTKSAATFFCLQWFFVRDITFL